MTVHFFEIKNCVLAFCNGYPLLIAPDGTDEQLLSMRQFTRQADGKWIRYVDRYEYEYILRFSDVNEAVFNDETVKNISYPPIPYPQQYYSPPPQPPGADSTAHVLCYISLGLMLTTVPVAVVGAVYFSGLAFLAALILMIVVRVNYPQCKMGKVLCIIYIILSAVILLLLIIGVIVLMVACNECANSMRSCS